MSVSPPALYLREDVRCEPLIDRWYAWLQLVPPVTAALNLTRRHLPVMDSFLSSPALHAAAVRNPKLLGGPFIDCPVERAGEIRELRERTAARRAGLVELAAAVRELDELLDSEATGHSLESLYARIPKALDGFVELQYDVRGNPSFRLLEPLLYRSSYYDPGSQSVALSRGGDDGRPFILSTPRLDRPDEAHVEAPFASAALDDLFRMRRRPAQLGELRERLGIDRERDTGATWEGLFTATPPPAREPYTGLAPRLRYYGHACLLIETAEVSILVDPVLAYRDDDGPGRFTYSDLPEHVDYVLITHHHQDHINLETLLQLRHKVGAIVVGRNRAGSLEDPSMRLLLTTLGFRNVVELDELDELEVPGGTITGIPFVGEHHDLAIASRLGYLVRLHGRSILALADSCNVSPRVYERVHEAIGDVDALFLGMECDGSPVSWAYGALHTAPIERDKDDSRRGRGSNFAEARALVDLFRCRSVYVYAMGLEPWLRHILGLAYGPESNPMVQSQMLVDSCRERGIAAERLYCKRELVLSERTAQA